MLDQIFQDYCDKAIDGNERLNETYARYANTPVKWIQCEDISVKNLINRICDDFEAAGFDLDDLPLDNIREKFIATNVATETPQEYIELGKAKIYIEEKLKDLHSIDALKDHPQAATIQGNLKETLDKIRLSMKGLT